MSGRIKPSKTPTAAAINAAISSLHALAADGPLEVRLTNALQAMGALVWRDLGPDFGSQLRRLQKAAEAPPIDADRLGVALADLSMDILAEGALVENKRSLSMRTFVPATRKPLACVEG
ncbi:MAG: hypothetical protein AAGA21_16335 [Pseudomonadota bacterium]